MTDTRCGFVALVGRPNVGKSTLLNHLLGTKLSITSRKPQTTRHNLVGIDTVGSTQIVYVDTPGIHRGQARAMNRYMVSQAFAALRDVDLVILLVEARRWTEADDDVLRQIDKSGSRCICALNKIDRMRGREALLPIIDDVRQRYDFEAIIPISALKHEGLEPLTDEITRRMPIGAHMFEPGAITDRPTEFFVAEIVREKILRRLGDEIPHRVAVAIERYVVKPHIVEMDVVVYVERKSQKGILIGKRGARLKSIGQDARRDIEELVGEQVMLRLWVKIKAGWTNDESSLKVLGYQ